jgi:hypothetical protein
MSNMKYTPWGLGGLLKKGKEDAQAPAITPPPTEGTDVEVQEAARAEATALKKRKGWRASLVTGPQGVTSGATTEKSLLGQ